MGNSLLEDLYETETTSLSFTIPEAVVRRCSVEKVFLENSQNSQENTCAREPSFTKVAGLCIFI